MVLCSRQNEHLDQCTSPLTLSRFVKESRYLNGPNMLRLSLQEQTANSNNLILSDTSFDMELETSGKGFPHGEN